MFSGDPDTFIDISETIDLKIQALRCHQSQIHDWPVDEWIRDRARERAEGLEYEFAESFKTFKLREREREEREREEQADESPAGSDAEPAEVA